MTNPPFDPVAFSMFKAQPDHEKNTEHMLNVLGRLQTTLVKGDRHMITEVKQNPGAALAAAIGGNPTLFADGKRKDAQAVMLVAERDIAVLVSYMCKLSAPRYATGADLYRRFAHEGEPSAVSLAPPREEDYASPALDDILGRSALTD